MTWHEEVISALEALGGKAHLQDIYAQIERTTARKLNVTWRNTVRQTLEDNSHDSESHRTGRNVFRHVGGERAGIWALAKATGLNDSSLDRRPVPEDSRGDASGQPQPSAGHSMVSTASRKGDIMSQIITRPAALVKQGNLKLYATSLPVADLLLENFYSIETLDPDNPARGYQRLLNTARAKKLADYLIEGEEHHDAFLPTSILLATDKDIPFDASANTITFDVAEGGRSV